MSFEKLSMYQSEFLVKGNYYFPSQEDHEYFKGCSAAHRDQGGQRSRELSL